MPFTERPRFSTESTTYVAALPPTLRVWLYFGLGLANAVLIPLIAAGEIDPVWGSIVVSVGNIFGFTLAGSNVTRTVTPDEAPEV